MAQPERGERDRDFDNGLLNPHVVAERVRSLHRRVGEIEKEMDRYDPRVVEARIESMQADVVKVAAEVDRRFAAGNEYREQLREQGAMFARIDIVDARFERDSLRIRALENFQSRLIGGLLIWPVIASVITGILVWALTGGG